MNFLFSASLPLLLLVVHCQKTSSKAKYSEKSLSHEHSGKQETTTQTCPNHFWFDKGTCVRKEEVPFSHVCRPGTLDEHGGCLEFAPPKFKCRNPKINPSDQQCLLEDEIPKSYFCPSGTVEAHKRCVLHFEEPPTCREGQALVHVGGQLKCESTKPAERKCPSGFSQKGLSCVKIESEKPFLVCPEPFERDQKDKDDCIFKTEVFPVCPHGFAETFPTNKTCVKFERKVEECPSGYKAEGRMCAKKETKPKEASCENGADPNHNCKKKVSVPLTPFCPGSWKLVGTDSCEKAVFLKASFDCPEGYKLKDSKCEKEVDYDCSVTTHKVECEEPLKPTKKEGHDRNLGEPEFGRDFAKEKYVREKPSHLPVCHKVPIVHPKTCKRTVTAEAIPFCKEGVYKGGNRCEIIERKPAEYRCESQTDKEGSCFVFETAEPIRLCPKGYTPGHGNACYRNLFKGFILKCPLGTTAVGGFCVKLAAKRCPGGSCHRTLRTPATATCPNGFAFQEVERKEKALCQKAVFADFHNFCRGKPTSDLYCTELHEVNKEKAEAGFPAEAYCRFVPKKFFADRGEKCKQELFVPAEPECKTPFVYNQPVGLCELHEHKINQCPKGSVHEKGKCWVFEKAEPIKVKTFVKELPSKKEHW